MTRFRSDSHYRQQVLTQERDLETRRQDIVLQENNFRQSFDRARFDSDAAYRADALLQQKELAYLRADLDMEQLGINRESLSQNAHQGMRNTLSQLYNTYQAAKATCLALPSGQQACLDQAAKDYDEARKEAGVFSGPSIPVVWTDPDDDPDPDPPDPDPPDDDPIVIGPTPRPPPSPPPPPPPPDHDPF